VEVVVKARDAKSAMDIARKQNSSIARAADNQLTVTSMGVVSQPAPVQPQPQTQTTQQGEFTGWWKIVDANNQELHRFNGIGNSQADANRTAAGWLGRNRPDMVGQGVAVVPVMN
jgi:hypothetical protein